MMWSRTSTVNKGSSLRINDGLAEYPGLGVENSRQSSRQIAKRNRRCQQCVEPWIVEQCDGSRETADVCPARTVRRRNASDLARYQPKPAAMEGAAKHCGHCRVAIPTHLEHRSLVSGQFERRSQPIGRTAGVNDEVAVTPCFPGFSETNPELSG